MLIVYHTRNLPSNDKFDTIYGTNGLFGAADRSGKQIGYGKGLSKMSAKNLDHKTVGETKQLPFGYRSKKMPNLKLPYGSPA